MSRKFYLNGRFLTQRPTGVQRSARHWLLAMDDLLVADGASSGEEWILLHPPGAQVPALRCIRPRPVGPALLRGHLWEQCVLPAAARDGVIVSLAGAAPWWPRRQVVTIHDAAVFDASTAYTPAFRLWYRTLFRHLAPRVDRILTVSEFSRARLLQALAMPSDRIMVVPNGADHLAAVVPDPTALDAHGLRPGAYVLCVASDNPNKNLARLKRALARSRVASSLPLVWVGGGNAQVFSSGSVPPHAADAQRLDIRPLGAVADGVLAALYRHAAVVVVPSLYEGFGLTAVEAMAMGSPVVAARVAALPEVCGCAAEWVNPLDEDDIARGVERVLGDPQRAAELVEAGHRRAEEFGWSAAARRLLAAVRYCP